MDRSSNKRRAQLKDFKNFLYLVWQHLRLPEPTQVQYDIADFLQSRQEKMCIQAYRQVGKTYIAAAFIVYMLYHNPEFKIAVVSKSKDFAKKITFHCLKLLEMPICKHMVPTKDNRSSTTSFDIATCTPIMSPSVACFGITSQVTGTRADIILIDDVEISENCATADARERLEGQTREFVYVGKEKAQIIYLGTPHTEDSLYTKLEAKGYEVRIWPFEVPEDQDFYEGKLTPYVTKFFKENAIGEILDEERWPEAERIKRLSEGAAHYRLQNMLDTRLSDADRRPLKIHDLLVMDVDPEVAPEKLVWARDPTVACEDSDVPCVGLMGDRFYRPWQQLGDWVPYTGAVMAIDPSGRGADETSYAVVKQVNGYFYVTACGGYRGGYSEETLKSLAMLAQTHKVRKIIVESNFGDGTWTELFRPVLNNVYPCVIEEIKHHKQKEVRILETLEPITTNHRLVIDKDVIRQDYSSAMKKGGNSPEKYMLMYQFSRFTRDRGTLKHDDRLDALQMAVQEFRASAAIDADKEMKRRQEESFDKYLNKHFKQDYKPKGPAKRYNSLTKKSDKPTWF